MKLTEDVILEAVERVSPHQTAVTLASPAGAPQVALHAAPDAVATAVLYGYYEGSRPGLPEPTVLVAGWAARDTDVELDGSTLGTDGGRSSAKPSRPRGTGSESAQMRRLFEFQRQRNAHKKSPSARAKGEKR
jgi:hypothetical protein